MNITITTHFVSAGGKAELIERDISAQAKTAAYRLRYHIYSAVKAMALIDTKQGVRAYETAKRVIKNGQLALAGSIVIGDYVVTWNGLECKA